jgi:hypothetical protein
MTTKKIELDVDFIGEQGLPLTKEEEKSISDFIRSNKQKKMELLPKGKGIN